MATFSFVAAVSINATILLSIDAMAFLLQPLFNFQLSPFEMFLSPRLYTVLTSTHECIPPTCDISIVIMFRFFTYGIQFAQILPICNPIVIVILSHM